MNIEQAKKAAAQLGRLGWEARVRKHGIRKLRRMLSEAGKLGGRPAKAAEKKAKSR
jgi:hypothetical protein